MQAKFTSCRRSPGKQRCIRSGSLQQRDHAGPSGNNLEALADYFLSCMPGCCTMKRKPSPSTDYELICSVEGLELYFCSELGRYFLCGCKDRSNLANFTAMAKFCRVLDSVICRFEMLLSGKDIRGTGTYGDAAFEQPKILQDRGNNRCRRSE